MLLLQTSLVVAMDVPPPPPELPSFAKPKKEIKKPKLPVLSEQEQEKFSDQLFLDTMVQLSNEAFVPEEKKGIDGYVAFIKSGLKRLPKEFKKRVALEKIIQSGGPFDKFVAEKIKRPASANLTSFLTKLYSQLEDPKKSEMVSQLMKLWRPAVFKANLLEKAVDDFATIVINLVVGLRKEGKVDRSTQIASDNLVNLILQEFVSKKKPLEWLIWQFNRLRINPSFLKFNAILGSSAVAKSKGKGALFQAKAAPLLIAWRDKAANKKEFIPSKNFLVKIEHQLFYTPKDFLQIKSDDPYLVKALNAYLAYLDKERKAFDVCSALEKLHKAKTIFDITRLVKSLSLRVDDASRKILNGILTNVASDDINVDKIISGFQQLCSPKKITFDTVIRKILDDYQKKAKIAGALLDSLKAIKKEYQKSKKPVDVLLYKKLSSISPLKDEAKKLFTYIYRTPRDIRRMVQKYVVGDLKKKLELIARAEDFYNWIVPYGLLLMIFKEVSEIELEENQTRLGELVYAVKALDSGVDISEKKLESYIPVIAQYTDVISGGAYRGKLKKLIQALDKFDISAVKAFVDNFVKRATMGIEKAKEYKAILRVLFQSLFQEKYNDIIKELSLLDENNGVIEGLELTGVGPQKIVRNNMLYENMKGMFKPITDSLSRDYASFKKLNIKASGSQFNKAKAAFFKKLDQLFVDLKFSDADKTEIIRNIKKYFDLLLLDLVQLQQDPLSVKKEKAISKPVVRKRVVARKPDAKKKRIQALKKRGPKKGKTLKPKKRR